MDVLPASAPRRSASRVRERFETLSARNAVFRFLLLAMPSGLLFGLFAGFRDLSLREGVISGLLFAVLFGGIMTVISQRRLAPLRSLSSSDRSDVILAVHRGIPINDARLANEVVSYADEVKKVQGRVQTGRRLNIAFVVLGIVVLLGALASHRPSVIVVDVAIFGLLIRAAVVGPRRRERVLSNAEAASRAARALLSAGAD